MNGIIVVKYYEDKGEEEDLITNFYVNVDRFYAGMWLRSFDYHTIQTIKLDQEDLDYLYKKYLPQYKIAVDVEIKEVEKRKQEEILELEYKLSKLKQEKK